MNPIPAVVAKASSFVFSYFSNNRSKSTLWMSSLTKNFILVTSPFFTVVTRHQFFNKCSTCFLSGLSPCNACQSPARRTNNIIKPHDQRFNLFIWVQVHKTCFGHTSACLIQQPLCIEVQQGNTLVNSVQCGTSFLLVFSATSTCSGVISGTAFIFCVCR